MVREANDNEVSSLPLWRHFVVRLGEEVRFVQARLYRTAQYSYYLTDTALARATCLTNPHRHFLLPLRWWWDGQSEPTLVRRLTRGDLTLWVHGWA